MKSTTMQWLAMIVIAIIALGGYFFPTVQQAVQTQFGGVTNYDEVDATAIKIGGTNGSRVGPIIASTCSLIASSYTVAASSSVSMDCAVAGVVRGDIVFAQFATTTGASQGWDIDGSSASTTSGFITLTINNGTGATAIIPASLASTTQYLVLHPRSTIPGL